MLPLCYKQRRQIKSFVTQYLLLILKQNLAKKKFVVFQKSYMLVHSCPEGALYISTESLSLVFEKEKNFLVPLHNILYLNNLTLF